MPPARTKDRLLDAAGAFITTKDGTQALTLDAVAEEAEVSKGGLLYHFKSKRELVEGMIDRWLADFEREIDEADPAFVRGYVRVRGAQGSELGMLAALIADPSLAVAVALIWIWQRDSAKGAIRSMRPSPAWPPTGLWLAELLGMGPPTGEAAREPWSRC